MEWTLETVERCTRLVLGSLATVHELFLRDEIRPLALTLIAAFMGLNSYIKAVSRGGRDAEASSPP